MANEDMGSRKEQLYIAALQLATREERAVYLKDACAGDAALRQRVEALLQAYEQARASLDPVTVKSAPSPNLPVAEQEEPVRRRVALKVIQLGMDTSRSSPDSRPSGSGSHGFSLRAAPRSAGAGGQRARAPA